MIDWLKRLSAPPVFPDDEDKTRSARLLHVLLLTLAGVILISATLEILLSGVGMVLIVTDTMGLIYLGLWVMMRMGRVRLVSVLTVSLFFISTTMILYFNGTIRTSITAFYIVCVIIAGLLLGNRGTIVLTVLSLAAIAGLLWAEIAGYLPGYKPEPPNISQWVTYAGILVVITMLLNLFIRSLTNALTQARQSNRELQVTRASLEERVEERTRELAQRNMYLEATTKVTSEIAATLELQDLLARVVKLVSEQFGFYHTGIFLMDTSGGEWVELQAASSAGGQRMLERKHRLRVEDKGVVGTAAHRGQARISLDTDADTVFLQNPDLPDTRSEVALPLRARGQTIGVLDAQSTVPQAFGEEDTAILQTLADQIALAISNARLFEQSQASLESERRAYGELTRQAWTQVLQSRAALGFVSDQQGTAPAGNIWEPQMQQALQTGQATVASDQGAALAIPIMVRGQAVGVMDVHRPGDAGEWTPDHIAMIQTLADQLGVALDSARLYQDTQRRAAQERILREFADQMQRASDMQVLIRSTADELNRVLGGSRAYARLNTIREGGN